MLLIMSVWETVRSWFKSEAKSGRELAADIQADWSADLDRKEAEMAATPEERIAQLQDEISDNASAFDDLKAKIESDDSGVDADFADPEES